MTKEEKYAEVKELTAKLASTPNVYITNAGGLSVAQVSELRGLCHKAGIEMRVVKNTLLRKAMEASELNYEEVFPALKEQSSVFFVGEDVNAPAKLLTNFRKKGKLEKPSLKAAFIDESVFFGDDALAQLEKLKSKNELIGEIIGLLQSPAKNVISALKSPAGKLAGILQTLEERAS